jgi:hypothetical protein
MEPWMEIRKIEQQPLQTRREAEKKAWRAIVAERLGPVEISYNQAGAPILPNGPGYIGGSHTNGWVSVVWSPQPCAVDIELKGRKISPDIAARLEIEPTTEAWCKWEAAYKFRSLTGREPNPESLKINPHPDLVIAVVI